MLLFLETEKKLTLNVYVTPNEEYSCNYPQETAR